MSEAGRQCRRAGERATGKGIRRDHLRAELRVWLWDDEWNPLKFLDWPTRTQFARSERVKELVSRVEWAREEREREH